MAFLLAWFDAFWALMYESGLWLIVGFAMAGAVHALIPAGFLSRHLAGRGPGSILKASLLGVPLPLCSCSVIPVASSLRRAGASKGATAAFAISTPQTGEESIPLTWALFGPVYAFARPIIAVLTAFLAGLLVEAVERRPSGVDVLSPGSAPATASSGRTITIAEQRIGSAMPAPATSPCGCAPKPEVKSCCSSGVAGEAKPSGGGGRPAEAMGRRIVRGLKHGFVTMPMDLAVWLVIGLVLAAGVTAAVPEGWIASTVGEGIVPMLLMLGVSVPLYICATSSTPLAFSLVAAGLSPGAALVLLLAGPATNMATVTWALKDLGAKATGVYLLVIAAVAVAAGLIFDSFFRDAVVLAEQAGVGVHGSMGWMYAAGAVALTMLLGWCVTMKILNALPGQACRV